jgi:lipopolysaccharide/colanic/teichoic acid biosynthesis glycosyltransferase
LQRNSPCAGNVPSGSRLAYRAFKRGADIVGSTILLCLSAPVLASIACAIKLTSKGPILYRQRRLGRNARTFECLKFRTMVPDAEGLLTSDPQLQEEFRRNFKLRADPRVTPVGAFLRRSSLDELPQLFHVLRGQMSLIGPRPIVPGELALYGDLGEVLLSVKPGLGGLWQASGRSDLTYEERVRLDVEYVRRRGVLMDLSLLARTAIACLRGRGAY